jgi:hypothetical protein
VGPACRDEHSLNRNPPSPNSDNLSRLTEFTGRFRGRFIELMSDVDARVAAEGLRLLATLVKTKQLPLSDIEGAYELLADEDEAVRRGAAALVAQLLEEQGAEAEAEREAAAQVRGGLVVVLWRGVRGCEQAPLVGFVLQPWSTHPHHHSQPT